MWCRAGGHGLGLVVNGLTCAVNLTNPAERCIPFPALNTATDRRQPSRRILRITFSATSRATRIRRERGPASSFDGPLLRCLPAMCQAVFGVEHRRAEIDDTPDPNSISGNLYNLTSATPTRGKDNVTEVYTEIEVPILAGKQPLTSLTFNGSFRLHGLRLVWLGHNIQTRLMYSPVKWVSLRVTEGTSFRAPALFEQFQGATSGFLSQASDPCNNYGAGHESRRCRRTAPLSSRVVRTSSRRAAFAC